jgi:hypothetical protein
MQFETDTLTSDLQICKDGIANQVRLIAKTLGNEKQALKRYLEEKNSNNQLNYNKNKNCNINSL